MSTWRRKALELFPDGRQTFSGKDDTIYTLFFAYYLESEKLMRITIRKN
jgi:hypothetical protein